MGPTPFTSAHALPDELTLFIAGHLRDARAEAILRHLPGCPQCRELLTALIPKRHAADTPALGPDDRRREHRIEIHDAATIRSLSPFSPRIIEAMAVDTSPSGVQIRMGLALPVESLLQIRISGKDETLIGEVRHCTQREGAYYVGVEIRAVFPAN